MQRRSSRSRAQSNGGGELRKSSREAQNLGSSKSGSGGIAEQIGGPFEAAPWYLNDSAQTVDLYSSLGYKSQLESSGHWRTAKKSPQRTPKADVAVVEYTADAPPPTANGGDEPPGPLEYHRETSGNGMSVSDERFEPSVSESPFSGRGRSIGRNRSKKRSRSTTKIQLVQVI